MSVHSIFSGVLLTLQLCLGFWQIGKLTPVGALIQCATNYLVHLLGLPTTYSRLKHIKGRMYKTVCCTVTMAYQPLVPNRTHRNEEIKSSYLGHDFRLERRNGNKLFVDGKMSYYITDTIWSSLLDMGEVASKTVFLKGYKEFWQQVATGGVMSLTEVLDCLILENQTIRKLDNDLLLPVNLSVSEEKLLKVLNLVGLFLQTKQAYWLIPTLLSFTSAVLEFTTSVRVWLYSKVNLVVCWAAHRICDQLPRSTRRQVYSLGSWVENLKPCNDIELRVVRGHIKGVIGGGVKTHIEGATLVKHDDPECSLQVEKIEASTVALANVNCNRDDVKIHNEGATLVEHDVPECSLQEEKIERIIRSCNNIDIGALFYPNESTCHVWASTVALADVDCNRDEFTKLCMFLSCVARNGSGSLKSCGDNKKVRVRGFRESVLCYAINRFPPVYELKMDHVVVE